MMASFVAMLHDNRLRRELGRYVVVGLLGYGILLAALVAGGLALLNNFLLNRHWTFEVGHGQVTRQARNYLLISAVFFAAQLAILHVLVVLGLPKVVAEGLSVFAVVPMNFLAQRRLAFRAW
jgi:putative flippase GtrA